MSDIAQREMALSEELKCWGYHSGISEEGKRQHLEMADKATQLEEELEKERDGTSITILAQTCDSLKAENKELRDGLMQIRTMRMQIPLANCVPTIDALLKENNNG